MGAKLSAGDQGNSQTNSIFSRSYFCLGSNKPERLIEGCLEIPAARGQEKRDCVRSRMLYRDA